jgi:hypothetical protein
MVEFMKKAIDWVLEKEAESLKCSTINKNLYGRE